MKKILLLTVALFLFAAALLQADWTPPSKPDPSAILNQARTDTRDGHYEDALAKHVWYHQNALKYEPALLGVRLSFALSQWAQLGGVYPPALEKLKSIRDETAGQLRGAPDATTVPGQFSDVAAIDRELREQDQTVALFRWLDENHPAMAKTVYQWAEPALLDAKEYQLCGKHNNLALFQRRLQTYQTSKRMWRNPGSGESIREAVNRIFATQTAQAVALAVLNGQPQLADQIAAQAEKEDSDADFKRLLEDAKSGKIPPNY